MTDRFRAHHRDDRAGGAVRDAQPSAGQHQIPFSAVASRMLAAPTNSATKRLSGSEIDVARRAHLGDRAVAHHHDAVAERHGLGLVVGDVDRGDPERAQQAIELAAQPVAQAASSAVSGSSSSSTLGRTATARASATRWRWPPES